MAAWVLVPCLITLRDEVNRIAPNRSKNSDGTIGDAAHQKNTSDHNDDEVGRVPIRDADKKHEVHAIDLDKDLNQPGLTMEDIVQFILWRCRKPNNDPDNEARLRYIIYNRRIWQAPGWERRNYTGPNAHTEHAHFSAEYETELENDTSPWHLEEIPVALTSADKTWLTAEIKKAVSAAVDDIWDHKVNVKIGKDEPPSWQKISDVIRHLSPEGHQTRALLNELLTLVKKPTT